MIEYPKLRSDVYFASEEQQPVVAVDGRRFVLPSRAMLTLLERLSPHLNGQVSLQSLLGAVPESQQRAVSSLLQKLHEVGAVRDHALNEGLQLPGWMTELYRPTLDYLEALGPAPIKNFLNLRQKHLTVTGTGSALRVFAPALWDAGLTRGTVQVSETDPARAPLLESLELRQVLDPDCHWTLTTESPVQLSDLLVVIGSWEEVSAALQNLPDGQKVLPVVLTAEFSTIGPVGGREIQEDLWVRMGPFSAPRDSYSAYSITGARAALEAFKVLAGADTPALQKVVRICQEQLTDTVHPLLPVQRPALEAPLDMDTLERSMAGQLLFNKHSGLMRQIDPEDLPQLPVTTWATRLREHPEVRLTFTGGTLQEARTQAVLGSLMSRFAGQTAGLNEAQWKGLGVLRHAKHQLSDQEILWDFEADLDADAKFWYRTLPLRFGVQPEIQVWASQVAGLPVAELRTPDFQVRAAGRTLQEALKTTLLLGVAKAQLEGEKIAPDQHPVQLPAAVQGQNLDWQDWLGGLSIQVHGTPDPKLLPLGLWVGRVTLEGE